MTPKLLAQGMAIGVGDESRAESRGPAFGTAGRAHSQRTHRSVPLPTSLVTAPALHPSSGSSASGAPAGLGAAPPPCPWPQRQGVLGEGPPGKTSKCFTIRPFLPTLPQLWALGMGGVWLLQTSASAPCPRAENSGPQQVSVPVAVSGGVLTPPLLPEPGAEGQGLLSPVCLPRLALEEQGDLGLLPRFLPPLAPTAVNVFLSGLEAPEEAMARPSDCSGASEVAP